MEIAYLITGLISLIMVICFFKMGSNIGKIKNILDRQSPNNALDEYNQHFFWGDTDLAVVKLKAAFWHEFKREINTPPAGKEERLRRYEELTSKYSAAFSSNGVEIPQWDGEKFI